jgi:hypothetical protein
LGDGRKKKNWYGAEEEQGMKTIIIIKLANRSQSIFPMHFPDQNKSVSNTIDCRAVKLIVGQLVNKFSVFYLCCD